MAGPELAMAVASTITGGSRRLVVAVDDRG
jgi:hypothetical protein